MVFSLVFGAGFWAAALCCVLSGVGCLWGVCGVLAWRVCIVVMFGVPCVCLMRFLLFSCILDWVVLGGALFDLVKVNYLVGAFVFLVLVLY